MKGLRLFYNERIELNNGNYSISNHKRGISVLEAQLEHYRENESKHNDDIDALKGD